MSGPLLVADDLVKSFSVSSGGKQARFRAVDGVSLSVERGRTLAVVGESGCGKSTVGSLLLRLQDADSGRILLDGEDASTLDRAGLRRFRRRVQVVFQDPFASLDPRERIRDVLMRPMLLHGLCDRPTALKRAAELMDAVGLSATQLDRFPHQFSGGQRQRIAIARALSVQPDLIICDEPVSALDVSVQAQVVNLLQDLQRDTGVAFIFISHDLAVVRHLAHDVAVMYAGRVVERVATSELFSNPRHPYTRALLAAAPRIDAGAKEHVLLGGEPPDPANPVQGCRFASRCLHAQPSCTAGDQPPLMGVAQGHLSACFLAKDLPPFAEAQSNASHMPASLRIAAYRRARDREAQAGDAQAVDTGGVRT
jgi:oligopeptide/dipeptide ABC transporter ATP-binding protein